MPVLRKMAKEIGRRHDLADELWRSAIHEARILAALIDDPGKVTDDQMERWVLEIDSWDVCDQLCSNLFSRTALAREKAAAWSGRPETFVKRAGFVLMACLAVHDKKADDAIFVEFLPLIVREAGDDRNFVKKAVNWALRQIGKRNPVLNRLSVETAREIQKIGCTICPLDRRRRPAGVDGREVMVPLAEDRPENKTGCTFTTGKVRITK